MRDRGLGIGREGSGTTRGRESRRRCSWLGTRSSSLITQSSPTSNRKSTSGVPLLACGERRSWRWRCTACRLAEALWSLASSAFAHVERLQALPQAVAHAPRLSAYRLRPTEDRPKDHSTACRPVSPSPRPSPARGEGDCLRLDPAAHPRTPTTQPSSLNPQPPSLNPQPSALNPRPSTLVPLLALLLSLGLAAAASAQTLGEKPQAAAWRPCDPAEARQRVFAWLDERGVDEATRAKAAERWPADSAPSDGAELLARLVETVALVDEDARRLVDLCSQPAAGGLLRSEAWLADPKTPPLVADNLRLWYGRWLAQGAMFDESRERLADLEPGDVVDPATLLFYQAVVHHGLMDREAGMKALERLLAGVDQSPRRYAAVARLMRADLKDLEPDSLDHIARRMDDVRRRLDLGHAGPKVRKIEDGVIESLDKLIEKLESQRQQAAAAGSGNLQPARPAEESRPMGGKGRGEVTKRKIGTKSGWGDLPPKQREEALQQIGREFPSHYRDAIEQYFRKLANEGGP